MQGRTVKDGVPTEERPTVVVHMVAGPGAGKTTAAYEVCAALKKLGYGVEYAPEYAKELIADGQGARLAEGSLATQRELCSEQQARIDRWLGKVDFVVTDSAPILGVQYLKESGPKVDEFVEQVKAEFAKTENFVLFVERGPYYVEEGRVQTHDEALQVDAAVKRFLDSNGVYYGTYGHDRIDLAVRNMQATLSRVTGKAPDDLRARGAVLAECTAVCRKAFAARERAAPPEDRARVAMLGRAEVARVEAAFREGLPASVVRAGVYRRCGLKMPRDVPGKYAGRKEPHAQTAARAPQSAPAASRTPVARKPPGVRPQGARTPQEEREQVKATPPRTQARHAVSAGLRK